MSILWLFNVSFILDVPFNLLYDRVCLILVKFVFILLIGVFFIETLRLEMFFYKYFEYLHLIRFDHSILF